MTTRRPDTPAADTPASLYGGVSLTLGVLSLLTYALLGIALSLTFGALALTFGILGLVAGPHRILCLTGLPTGAPSVLFFLYLLIADA
ncbi:hypothetical protein JJV70_20345 [Streptomyces sp. JJ66]|uniref:hypothetical protein n=1 Tax=Streptomyces sp. JJ66 TaxID=2803843 RepID=UPI001C57163C|nr:hypothetical protein [Streptomyces sp. JJ66]MBW1604409.1 hypothetical protein [Streptomyces sp. JJ66]